MEEAGLAPVRYVATSMGAVVAAALAGGRTATALLGAARRTRGGPGWSAIRSPLVGGLFARSLLRAEPFPAGRSSSWSPRAGSPISAVPLTVSVVDLDTGGAAARSARGARTPRWWTCSAPPARCRCISRRSRLAGRRCGDGGLRGPLPLEVAARLARETVVAVDVGPGSRWAGRARRDGLRWRWPPLVRAPTTTRSAR